MLRTLSLAATSIMPPLGSAKPTGMMSLRRDASSGAAAITICGAATSPGDDTCGGEPTYNDRIRFFQLDRLDQINLVCLTLRQCDQGLVARLQKKKNSTGLNFFSNFAFAFAFFFFFFLAGCFMTF